MDYGEWRSYEEIGFWSVMERGGILVCGVVRLDDYDVPLGAFWEIFDGDTVSEFRGL